MYSSQTKYVCPTYFTCTDTLSSMTPLVRLVGCRCSSLVRQQDLYPTSGAAGGLFGRDRASGPPNPDFPSLFTSLLSTSGLTRPFLFATWRWIVSPPGAASLLVLRTSGHHGHGPRIQLTWMALRSTCLHLKGCRSSLAIHRRCLVLGRRHHLCRRRRHHLLPCHRRRRFHLHLRLSWPGYRSSAWMRPPPSRARKARACRMPLCAACERSRHQLRLSCRRREH